ncbi:MAG TPA: tetratricopeptide repeat protein [Streptosporangiaceae bacterium]
MTVSAAACTRPACTGSIDGGYCTVCGLAPPAAGSATRGPAVPAQGAAPPGSGPASAGSPASGPSAAGSLGSGSTGTWSGSVPSGTRRSRRGSSRSSRGRLGAGLVDIPPVPARDPAAAILANPQVPASKRFCGTCERPVGRDRDGQPGLAEGYCPHCGTPFSFVPKLAPGELVGGQYEVLGCLAHGGLGWIYLGMDRHLGNRWVVLKGLLNSGDTAAQEAALAERRFLAEVEHPNIVGVYNFVEHADRRTGEVAGYIVMEYVGGKSLKQILLERRQLGQSLPLPVALAYAIEVLPALGYLHSRGLVYCDFKPDNVIQTEEQLKLIDMGGVRRTDDVDSAIYGTVGYQAPEIADRGPSPSSDLYTVGRALAVLSFEFTGYQGRYANSLPDPATVPVLAASESFLRALLRATDPDPDRRFASASEMAEQLTGVLREVLAVADQQQRPSFSTLFSPEVQTAGVPASQPDGQLNGQQQRGQQHSATVFPAPEPSLVVAGLPVPQVDSSDPAAGYLATLSTLDPDQRTAALIAAVRAEQNTPAAVAESPETQLALARSLIVGGDLEHAAAVLSFLAGTADADWRTVWYQGLRELAARQAGPAQAAFDTVCATLPGELAAKLALAFAAEAAGDLAAATWYFQLVWAVDQSYVSAAFGVARTRLAAGDRAGAIAALAAVPATSSHHQAAQIAAVRLHVTPDPGQSLVSADDVQAAGSRLSRLTLDEARQLHLTGEVLKAALDCAAAGQSLGSGSLLGCPLDERALRFALEQCYRDQARLAPDRRHRVELIDLANVVRPRTWS